jgi:hypothetical protein
LFDLNKLASNPNISMDDAILLNKHGINVDLSRNAHLQISDIINNLEYKWNMRYITTHHNITMDIINKYSVFGCDVEDILKNPNLRIEDIKKQKYLTTICDYVFDKTNLPMEDLILYLKSRNKIYNYEYGLRSLSKNKNFTIDLMYKYIYELKDYDIDDYLSYNQNIIIQFVKDTIYGNLPNIEWDWSELLMNPGIKIKDIFDNPELPWGKGKQKILINPKLDINDTYDNIELSLDENWINKKAKLDATWWLNPNVTADDLIKHNKMEPAHWSIVSLHTYIIYILNNKQYPWNWDNVSRNPDLTVYALYQILILNGIIIIYPKIK